jgi:hypothetical protein
MNHTATNWNRNPKALQSASSKKIEGGGWVGGQQISQLNKIGGLHLLQPLCLHPNINILMGSMLYKQKALKRMDNLACIQTWKPQG